jgi:hypothetical protein
MFMDGFSEEWMAYRNLEVIMQLKVTLERTKTIRTLPDNRKLAQFDYHCSKRVRAEDIELPDHELLELVIRDLGLDYICRRAIRLQKYYMRK